MKENLSKEFSLHMLLCRQTRTNTFPLSLATSIDSDGTLKDSEHCTKELARACVNKQMQSVLIDRVQCSSLLYLKTASDVY
jgi:hypothetical protein